MDDVLPTEQLIGQMLQFLDDVDDSSDNTEQQQIENKKLEDTKHSENPFCREIKKIINIFPTNLLNNWKNCKTDQHKTTSGNKVFSDAVWNSSSHRDTPTKVIMDRYYRNSSSSSSSSSPSNDPFVQEVNRAFFGLSDNHPRHGSTEYFAAAENYAIYGKDFLDFPPNHAVVMENAGSRSSQPEQHLTNCVQQTPPLYPDGPDSAAQSYLNYGVLTSEAAGYFQTTNPVNQPISKTPPANYGMYLGKNVTYLAAMPVQAAAPSHQQILLSQQQTAANFCSTSGVSPPNCHAIFQTQVSSCSPVGIAGASQPFHYSNPMLTAQYLNTFLKETHINTASLVQQQQYLSATGIYERLFYAQMLQQQQQQQIQHQTRINQQQLAVTAAVASMHKSLKLRSGGANSMGTFQDPSPAPTPASSEVACLSNGNDEEYPTSIAED